MYVSTYSNMCISMKTQYMYYTCNSVLIVCPEN